MNRKERIVSDFLIMEIPRRLVVWIWSSKALTPESDSRTVL